MFMILCGIKFLESERFAIQVKTSQIKLYIHCKGVTDIWEPDF